MNKFFVLLQQNYTQKLKSKTFVISTVIYLLIMLGFAFFNDIKELFKTEDEATNVVLFNETESTVIDQWQLGEDIQIQIVDSMIAVEQSVKQEDASVGLVFSEVEGKLVAKILSKEPLKLSDQTFYNESLAQLGTSYAFEKIQLTPDEQVMIAQAQPVIEMTSLNEKSSKTAEEKQAGMFGSYFVGILIYIFVISYLSVITTDVASEKGSRALEMLLVSIKPESHFKAKVFGTLLVAFTQFAIMIVAGIAVLLTKGNDELLQMIKDLAGELDASYIVFVLCFLILTLILYLIIGALFGSLVSKVEEASQVMMPAMIVVIVAFYVMVMALNNPDSMLVKVSSYIPFTSGMVMPMRLGGTDMSLMEPFISLLVLVVSVAAVYKFSLVYYKRSVLTYSTGGVMTKLRQLFKVSN